MRPNILQRLYSTHRSVSATTPRRALLYVPGTDEKKIRKAATQLDVDSVCMDCEDGVADSRKEDARNSIVQLLSELDFGRSERGVRINPVASGLADEDLRALFTGKTLPDVLVLPKVESAADIHWLFSEVKAVGRTRIQREKEEPMAFISMCESARGLLNLREIFEAARDRHAPLHLQACIFGGDDFAASIGATRSPSSRELLHARQSVVIHCRAYNVQPIDIVNIDYHNTENLKLEAEEGARMGFAGKQVIHPSQVEPVQAAFTPTAEQFAAAQELIDAFEAHQKTGIGAFSFKGQMIDMPTVLQAKNVMALAERA